MYPMQLHFLTVFAKIEIINSLFTGKIYSFYLGSDLKFDIRRKSTGGPSLTQFFGHPNEKKHRVRGKTIRLLG